jgi:TRAP-type C4-dicarboxylate transport system permease small subunit
VKLLRRIIVIARDVLELYLPAAAFVCMFIAFILGVFTRYVLRNPLRWTFEVSQICFVWTGILGACYAQRYEDHIVFSMIYDGLTPLRKNVIRIVAHLMVLVMVIAIGPSINYLLDLDAITSVLEIPRAIVFAPYAVLLVVTIIRYGYRLVLDIKALKNESHAQAYNTEEKESLL